MKLKTGDKVKIIAGKEKGKEGTVIQVFGKLDRIVIDGINLMTKHVRKRGREAGQKVQFPSPIHVSNVKLIGPSGTAGRAGYKVLSKDGKNIKVRVVRKAKKEEEIE
ncbi:MAG: 50S ribosomal protein L24 [uncultured bacterium]|nr:MAG: 50S ribosomal protein L24 [uncultured bacterium]HBD05274.1 50S ribosomal protein L24 [Candidatus Uhrbacteria bacterium]